jgi:pimeloyl-ACP methyl ester carboxylesterase
MAPYTTMSPAGLRTGVVMSAAECAREASAIWVTAPHADGVVEGACIRYYAAGLAASNPVAVVFLHGNRLARSFDKEGRLIRIDAGNSYGTPSVSALQAAAAIQAKALGHPFIIVARPGYYGSSGVANDQYRRREILLVNAALEAIKQRHAIARFGVSSQSGGGPALAGLLALRDDIPCAAFSSSLTAFDERERALREPSRNPPLRQVTPDAYDPIRETANIRPSADRRVFIVGDPNDALIPLAAQQAYADALKRQGVHVAMTSSTAVGHNHHSLGATGQRAVGWCLDGVSDAEILTRMGKGEAAYKLDGGFY